MKVNLLKGLFSLEKQQDFSPFFSTVKLNCLPVCNEILCLLAKVTFYLTATLILSKCKAYLCLRNFLFNRSDNSLLNHRGKPSLPGSAFANAI